MVKLARPATKATEPPVEASAATRLLLVDDEPDLREPLAEYLSRQGFAVTEVASAAQARSRLREELPAKYLPKAEAHEAIADLAHEMRGNFQRLFEMLDKKADK